MRRSASIAVVAFLVVVSTFPILAAPANSRTGMAPESGAIPDSFTFRGPDNVGGRTHTLWIDRPSNWHMIAGAEEGFWETNDGGFHWNVIPQYETSTIYQIVQDPVDANVLYAATSKGGTTQGLLRSPDRGATWAPAGPRGTSVAVAPSDPRVLLVGSPFTLNRSVDGGTSWTQVVPDGASFEDLHFDPRPNRRAVGVSCPTASACRPYYSTDNGATWLASAGAPSLPNTFGAPMRVAFVPSVPDRVILVAFFGSYAEVWRSEDGGASFSYFTRASIADSIARSLWVAPDALGTLLVGTRYLYRSVDGGITFTNITAPVGASPYAGSVPHTEVFGVANDPGYASVKFRRVFVLTDGGIWRANDITSASAASGFENMNRTYNTMTSTGVGISPAGDVAVASNATGYAYLPAGSLLAVAGKDLAYTSNVEADPVDRHTFYVAADSGTILRISSDGSAEARLYGPSSLRSFTAALTPAAATALWIGDSFLMRIDDARSGTAAHPVSEPAAAGVTAVAVSRRLLNTAFFANGITIYRSSDAYAGAPVWGSAFIDGLNSVDGYWPVQQIVLDPTNDSTLYMRTPYALAVSYDGGLTATMAQPPGSDPSISVAEYTSFAVHPRNNHWLYLGGRTGLLVSKDGGVTWLRMPGFIGNADIRDLRFRMGTTELYIAVYGRGIWMADVPGEPLDRLHGVRP